MKSSVLTMGLATILCFCIGGARGGWAQELRTAEQNSEFHRAEAAWRSGGSLLEAKARLDEVIAAIPSDAQALKLRTKILLAMERPADAFQDAKKVSELVPEDGEANLLLTRAARLVGDSLVAISSLQRAAATLPPDADTHIHLSVEAMHLNRYEEAESLARVAVALDANNGEARMQLARVLGRRGKTAAAITTLRSAKDLSLLSPERISKDSILRSTGVSERFLSESAIE